MRISMPAYNRPEIWALVLRVGLGCVFVIGGWFKLSKLLSAEHQAAIVAKYMSPHGYINQFFAEYLFTGRFGDWLTPWTFLTALSTFELLAGLALVAGFLVRPLSLIFAFMMWSFIFALPVATAPGMAITVDTFTTPAMLVQSRDIALSGMMFVVFNLGSGAFSVDEKLFGPSPHTQTTDWNSLGLLLRLSIAVPFLVGGAFAGLPAINTFRDRWRRDQRSPEVAGLALVEDGPAEPVATTPDPERSAMGGEFKADVEEALLALPDDLREVAVLFFVEGLSHREMRSRRSHRSPRERPCPGSRADAGCCKAGWRNMAAKRPRTPAATPAPTT